MLTPRSRLQPNEGEVAAKVMDGEAILINISTGMYHSMDQAGGFLWPLIEKGHSLEQMAEAVSRHFEVTAEQAREDVTRLAGALVEENLVTAIDGDPPALDLQEPSARQPYDTPKLNSYRDMSDLLALDPPMPGLQQIPWDESSS